MNRALTSTAAAILTAALQASFPSPTAAQLRAPTPPAPATRPAAEQADVPVKQVVLFSSGVGYFEHFGTVKGDGTAELRFKTDQINDVLKSLVLQDLDKGTVGTVSYPSQEPIAKTLRSFQVDITNNPPLAELLNQLRGARIDIALADGNLKGTIVGVEKRQDQVVPAVPGGGDKPQLIEYWVLNLKVGSRFRSVSLNQVRDFALDDPKLEEELDKALAALASARDQEKKPVTIQFRGQGERRVRMGYVVETPIWKTSYRLVLAGPAEADKPAGGGDAGGKSDGAAGPETRPAQPAPAGPAAPADLKAMQESVEILKGWADNMDGQYGSIHPAVRVVRGRQKEIEAAIKAGRLSPPPAPPERPADELDRKGLEDEIEVLRPWVDGYERGYGKDHPAVAPIRERVRQVEQVLAGRADAGDRAAGPATRPATPAGRAGPRAPGKLQGWAIVENQTDNDWNDVQLSLVSGRPLSFIQDLYHPLYIPRPVVYPNLYASLRPQTYGGGISSEEEQKLREAQQAQQAGADQAPNFNLESRRSGGGGGGGGGGTGLFGNSGGRKEQLKSREAPADQPMDPTASVIAAASAAQLGELFEYTIGSVTLARQKSAMIPIVTDEVDVEKVSIYNAGVLETHPLNGANVRNTTRKHLLQGPVTVLEAGGYAGDARIDDVPPGQSRLLSYGIDLNVTADPNERNDQDTVQTGKIVKGVLELTRKQVQEQLYVFQNKGGAGKTIIVEHPREEGWVLEQPKTAEEKTDQVYRFRTEVGAHQTTKFPVRFERVEVQQVVILPTDVGPLVEFARTKEIPDAVRAALGEVIRRKQAMVDTQRQIDDRKKQLAEVSAEQNRLRENLKTVAQNTEYYTRLMKKLDEQETSIERLQKEAADLQKTLEAQRKDLEGYVAGLNVG